MCTANKLIDCHRPFPVVKYVHFTCMYNVIVLHMHMWYMYVVLAYGLRSNMEAGAQTA